MTTPLRRNTPLHAGASVPDLVDITNTGAQAASGDTDCAIVLPDFNIPILMEEQVNVLYDGATSADRRPIS